MSFPESVEPTTAKGITDAWAAKFGTTRGAIAVIGGGGKFDQLTPLSPADGDIQSLKEQTTARIGAVFRIPSHMLEIFSGAKYSNVQVRNTAFYRDSVSPLTTLIEQKLTAGLLEGTGLVVRFDSSDLLRGDLIQSTTVAVDALGAGILTVDEARALMATARCGKKTNRNKERTQLMWIIKRPNGTQYTRKSLDALKVAYGFDKEGLEALGWVFKFNKAKATAQKGATDENNQ